MLTTGLLSLSVHEALTFDGTEIAFHPDLFIDPRRPSGTGASVSSIITVPAGAQQGILHRSLSSENSLYPPIQFENSSLPGDDGRLEVGNMVEIRVWDAIPGANICMSPPTKRQLDSSNNDTFIRNYHSSNAQPLMANTLPTSVQHSSESPLQLPGRAEVLARNMGGDESTVSSREHCATKEEIQTPSLPSSPMNDRKLCKGATEMEQINRNVNHGASGSSSPLPPRHPTSLNEGVPRTFLAAPLSKPPLVLRSRTPNVQASDQRRVVTSSPKPPYLATKSHVREMSDMTMETLVGTPFLGEVDSGLDSTASQDDDDDALTKISRTHTLRLSFVMLVTEKSLTSLTSTARTQVSILRQVAELYSISSYDMVTVNRIEKADEGTVLEAVSADFVTVTIQDQFIGRGDMYLFQKSLIGRWIYEGERINDSSLGIKANAREIRHKNRLAKSGIITERSVITFRSRSARIMWLVQLSSEMWDYASPYEMQKSGEMQTCELYFDKFVRFMYKLFKKWKDLKVSHSLTVVFFSRTFIGRNQPGLAAQLGDSKKVNVDVYGRIYEDHYKTVIENETNNDWDKLICRIKEAFVQYPIEVGWNLIGTDIRQPSNAMQGNILEAINVCLNLLQFHYLDRDLHRTGNSVVVVSPSNGVFEVDKGLAAITFQRMMDNGIGSDMLSLGLPPLHIAPFFLYNHAFYSVDSQGVKAEHTYYEVPHWMHLSFVSYDSDDLPLEEHEHDLLKKSLTPKPEEGPALTMTVGANGFLLSKFRNEHGSQASPGKADASHSKSFTALANLAASPKPNKVSQSQQRALIEGRDFQDILEACRPRLIHTLPSALVAQLKMNETTWNNEPESIPSRPKGNTISRHQAHERLRLKEWGTVDFDDVLKPTLHADLSGRASFAHASIKHDSEPCEKSNASPSSSFASQLSSALGRSFDHASPQRSSFLASLQIPSGAPTAKGIHLQRSPSIEFEALGETDSNFAEDDRSECSSSTRDANNRKKRLIRETVRNVLPTTFDEDAIRCLMRQHDKTYFKMETSRPPPMSTDGANGISGTVAQYAPATEDEIVRPLSGVMIPSGLMGNVSQGGGLAAALTDFNNVGDHYGAQLDTHSPAKQRLPNHVQSSHLRPRSLGGMDSVKRPRAPLFAMPPIGLPSGSGSSGPPEEIPRPWHFQRLSETGLRLPSVLAKQLVRRDSEHAYRHGQQGEQRPHEIPVQSMPRSIMKPYRTTSLIKSPTEVHSPPRHTLSRNLVPTKQKRDQQGRHTEPPKQPLSNKQVSRRQKSAFNPFRQRDEEEELAKKSHNRRRWSHVFPLGEVEFKRHSGPSWKSLCQPAILPLTVDYLPPLRDAQEFDVHPYQVTLFGSEQSHYTTHKDLFLEMVRHRLTQDYQVVPAAVVSESSIRDKVDYVGSGQRNFRPANSQNVFKRSHSNEQDNIIQHILSMGHRVHILAYNPSSDTIDVTIYNKKISKKVEKDDFSDDDTGNISIHYRYMMFSHATLGYTTMTQTFKKYSKLYKWNAVDHTLGDNQNKSLEPGMRFRRLMFSLIPPKFDDTNTEQAYIDKFKRLLEYLVKLRERNGAPSEELFVNIISVADERPDPFRAVQSARHGTTEERDMKRFFVDLRKGKQDLCEWLEIAIDAAFDTTRTYRLMINWLVASSSKVETQVQLLHRRCAQYGLKLHTFPQTAISRNIFLNPYRPPPIITVREESKAKHLYQLLLDHDFVDDGIHMTRPNFLSCVEEANFFQFRRNPSNTIVAIPGRQFVHRSTGALFIRLIRDEKGSAILAGVITYTVPIEVKAEAILALGKLKEGVLSLGEDAVQHDTGKV